MNEDVTKLQLKWKVLIVSAAAAIILILSAAALYSLDILKFPGSDQNTGADEIVYPEGAISDMQITQTELTDIFAEKNTDDPFSLIIEIMSYKREFRIISIYNNEYSVEKYTLIKKDDSFRVTSDSKTVICDGERLYIENPAGYITTDAAVNSMYSEIGITPLSLIIEKSDQASIKISDDGKYLTVILDADDYGISYEYKISVESGIVTEEHSYMDGELFRSVVTDSYDIFSTDISDSGLFRIPSRE